MEALITVKLVITDRGVTAAPTDTDRTYRQETESNVLLYHALAVGAGFRRRVLSLPGIVFNSYRSINTYNVCGRGVLVFSSCFCTN